MNKRVGLILFLLAVVTYSTDVKPILDGNCIECHSAGNALDLTQFPFTCKDIADQPTIVSTMLAKAGANPAVMPPGNRPKLSADDIGTIQDWLSQGLAP